jgi:UDP-N-acetylglucosamine 1-carboxyvinyltransferase
VVTIESDGAINALDLVRTSPYPGFPTDMQPQLVALLARAKGTSVIVETVFENRFRYTEQLQKMGSDINVQGRTAIIRGVDRLKGASVGSERFKRWSGPYYCRACCRGRNYY